MLRHADLARYLVSGDAGLPANDVHLPGGVHQRSARELRGYQVQGTDLARADYRRPGEERVHDDYRRPVCRPGAEGPPVEAPQDPTTRP
jgi:hypothetical protein